MSMIESVFARQILDSRGNPTVEVDIVLDDGIIARASVPSGASTGKHEAIELRDDDPEKFHGKSVMKAIHNIIDTIAPQICSYSVYDQVLIDRAMIDIDASTNKSNLGANATLGVSIAVAKAAALSLDLPLYSYLGGINARYIPVPQLNVINGGAHADNNLDIQEFMLVPAGMTTFTEAIRSASEIYHSLKAILKKNKLSTSIGDEGGFAPDLKSNQEAFDLLISAVSDAGYRAGEDIFLAIDSAASEFFKSNKYVFEGKKITSNDLISIYEEWVEKYPIISIEDGLAEDDWNGWKTLTERLGDRVQLVGDDLFVTNGERLRRGIDEGCANAILIKPNQIGTLTETLEVVEVAKENNYATVISHRSGETTDTFITDIAVGLNLMQIKTGAPARGERVCKYNNLIRIEEELGDTAIYAGKKIIEMWVKER